MKSFQLGEVVVANDSEFGIVIGIEREFYSHPHTTEKSDRVHVMWHSGLTTQEPAGWLSRFKEHEE